MVKIALEVSGFTTLPVIFSSASSALSQEVKHYIYLKPHDPPVADENAPRSLFLVNIPVATTELHLRHLFVTQLQSGRIENLQFSDDGDHTHPSSALVKGGRKRKRLTAEEIEAGLDKHILPAVFQSEIHPSGSSVVVVFVDRPSMEASFKAAKRAVKAGTRIVWGEDIEDKMPRLGLARYTLRNELQYPSRKDLLQSVDAYMSAYSLMEEARSRENARKRALPDEDGFVIVTRGARGAVKAEEAKEAGERQKEKEKGRAVGDFYRFQMREKRKEEHVEMLKKFEADKRRVREMREQRGG